MPLLPDLLLPSSLLKLEVVLIRVGDLSRLIDPTEPRNWSVEPPAVSWMSEERRLLEKTFLMPLMGREAMGAMTGDV